MKAEFKKTKVASDYFRETALEYLDVRDSKNGLRGMNLAVAFGRIGEEELGLAFLERAKYFMKIREIKLAIRDTRLARENKCPKYLLKKIEGNLFELEKKFTVNILKADNSLFRNKAEQKFFKLSSPNSRLEHAEDFVEIEYSADRGRRLVLTRNVNAGIIRRRVVSTSNRCTYP